VAGSKGQVCYGTGSFMALPPPRGVILHPVPLRNRRTASPLPLKEKSLSPEERTILDAQTLRSPSAAISSTASGAARAC
jgi:hypothetical protein